jgi:hypothetical protein
MFMKTKKILFLAANPVDTRHLTLDEEIRKIKERLDRAPLSKNIELVEIWAARPDDWLQALNAQHFHAIHFSGHGTRGGALQFMRNDGTAQPVTIQTLKEVFQVLKGDICLVVLNACYSSKQAEVLTEVVDCVVSMNDTVHDGVAITFIDAFYRALFAGQSIHNSFEQGKLALKLQGLQGDKVPELLIRPGIDATRVTLISSSPLSQRTKAFIGFNPKDERFLTELHTHLKYYVQKGTIDYWDRTMMLPGAKWRETTRDILASTRVAVLLVSADLLASTFMEQELPLLQAEAEKDATTILCVLLRPCAFRDTDLMEFEWVNTQPLSGMSQRKRDEVWDRVATLVQDILQNPI